VADGFLHGSPHPPERAHHTPNQPRQRHPRRARMLWPLDVCLRAVRETSGHAPARDTDRAALRVRVSVQHRSGRRAPRACHPFFPFKALAFATGCPAGKYTAAVAARCLPRYALLAWLGATVRVPAWAMVALFVLLMVPSFGLVWWPRAAS